MEVDRVGGQAMGESNERVVRGVRSGEMENRMGMGVRPECTNILF